MGKGSSESFIVDTSAFISLASIGLFKDIIKSFTIITTSSVIKELKEFAMHNDDLGKLARHILRKKSKLKIQKAKIIQSIHFLQRTDNELFNLALKEKLPLITDDHKLNHHTQNVITVYFSTFFLVMFLAAGKIAKPEALSKLEVLRNARNWKSNIIYLTTKEQLENI
ncbi:MAG: hypothetical protein ABIB71_05860 [Candidatus Woesearchaeota archaeon]